MNTVFVTGAEGFVGRRVVTDLLDKGCVVVGGVRNRARKLAFEKQYGRALVCDVSDAINVARVVASIKPDGIIHLAGESLPHRAGREPLSAYQSIVTAWANVLDAVRRTVPRARVVLASSCEVYGNAAADGQPLAEDAATQPVSPFGSMKLTAESVARTYFRNFHLNLSIARPFQAIGSGLPHGSFFGALAAEIAGWDAGAGRELAWPDLSCRRDLLAVEDAAAAYVTLLEHGQPNEIYNICSGEAPTVGEAAGRMVSAAGVDLSVTPLADEEGGPAVATYCGDNSRLRSLGWSPRAGVEQAITSLMESLQAAPQAV